jgi:Transglutaminase-like superfamily
MSPVARAALVAEILAVYVRVRWDLRRAGLRPALESLRAQTRRRAGLDPVALGHQLARPVARTLAVLPADSRCLMQSLVLTRLLARRGVTTQLVISVRPGEHFAAHAWIEHGGVPLLPADAPAFEHLVTL